MMNVYSHLCPRKSCLRQCKRTRSTKACTRELSEWPWTGANGVRRPEYYIGGGAVCNCVRGIVYECSRGTAYERVQGLVHEWTRGAVYECQRGGRGRVRLIYDVGALAPKIATRCSASPSALLSCLNFACVVETTRVLKQGVCQLHCWFTETDVNLLLTREHFLLPARKLVDLTRLFVSAIRSSFLLWWFNWFVSEKSCCVVKLHRRRQFLGGV